MSEKAETAARISDMLHKIEDEKLLNRIYRFVKYIYIHVDNERHHE